MLGRNSRMKTKKIKERAFAFCALLFEKSAECMELASDLLKGDKSVEIKIKRKGGSKS